jgi:hypothetical protein
MPGLQFAGAMQAASPDIDSAWVFLTMPKNEHNGNDIA